MLTKMAEALLRRVPIRYQNTARQFMKFGVTGTIGAIVDFTTFNILIRGVGFTTFYTVFGLPILVANNVSVLLAIVSNFLLNKYWTFRDTEENVVRQWTSYLALNIFTWILNQLLMSYFTFRVPLMEALFGDQKDNASKALAIGIILFINFLGSKFLIFRKRPAVV